MQERFEKALARWRKAEEKEREYRFTLRMKYGDTYYYGHGWLKSETKRFDAMKAATEKAADAVYTMLDEISPRNWRSGVGVCWAMENLTWEIATTRGPIEPVPPTPYGYYPSDTRRWAAAIA